ncbi:MAG: tRNA (adenosine(37)-N6)-dimethylallyltransferase MiaA [Clostridiales bacterium]|nr:tRNA (adenosine(37)-N6)-dimethylallyltransferase MiaA [Clostridiales bacterium]
MNAASKNPLVILTGPTAVGKTSLSIKLAKSIDGEIISADSMQIYKKMNIGTAKICRDEMDGVPHFLVDELDPAEEFNVVRFQHMAKKAVESIYARGHIPIVVGGTGFYIQALLYDIDFSDHESAECYRQELAKTAEKRGKDYLYERLRQVDPEYAAGLHANNVKRVIRALEYYHETGEKLSSHNAKQQEKASPFQFVYFVLNQNREVLYDRINRRADHMIDMGLPDEVKSLVEEGYGRDLVSMQGIGYKEFFPYFDGEKTLEETVERIKQDTRHFAKRQLTWFRREKEVCWMDRENYENEDMILKEMLRIIREQGIYSERQK